MTDITNIDRNDLIDLAEELSPSHGLRGKRGVRAVAAWQALCEPGVTYDLDDEETPYEFRDAVGTDIGWNAAQKDLDPNGDIPRYETYLRLHAAFGADWPEKALRHYLQDELGIGTQDAEAVAQVSWCLAVQRYERLKEKRAEEQRRVEAAEAAAAKADKAAKAAVAAAEKAAAVAAAAVAEAERLAV